MTISAISRLYKVSRMTIYQHCRTMSIPINKPGGGTGPGGSSEIPQQFVPELIASIRPRMTLEQRIKVLRKRAKQLQAQLDRMKS